MVTGVRGEVKGSQERHRTGVAVLTVRTSVFFVAEKDNGLREKERF